MATVFREHWQLDAMLRWLIPWLYSLRISRYLVILRPPVELFTLLKCINSLYRKIRVALMSTEVALFYEQGGSKKSERWLSTEILFNRMIKEHFSEKETIELIKKLVSSPSHEGIENQETEVANHIYDFFVKEGIEAEIIPVCDGRCNVIARLKGKGTGKTLLLTGHTDTVPPYDIQGNPYKIKVQDGRMYARGVVDMKAGLACMMMAMAAIKRSKLEIDGDVIFAGVIDEEAKSEGTRALLKSELSYDAAIVSEPSSMKICIAHRGLEWLEFSFHGKTVHGGEQEKGINAIEKAMKFIYKIENELIPELKKRKNPIIGSSSMNYGLIRGGTQPSTVAGECKLQIDRRWIPGEKYSDILDEYKKIEISYMDSEFVHEAMNTDSEEMIVKIAQKTLMQVTSEEAELKAFTAWTDGGLINYYKGIPTIILGPGSLKSAHSTEEHVEIDAIVPAVMLYALISLEYCKQ